MAQKKENTNMGISTRGAEKAPRGNLYAKYGSRNLRFLLDILNATGHSPHSFGLLTDNPTSTSTALRKQLNSDDMKLTRAKEIVSTLGYQLSTEIREKNLPCQEALGYKLILPKTLQKNLEKGFLEKKDMNKNLTFLREFLSRNGIPKRELARAIELSPGAVETWFKNDDIAISHIFRIGEVYDAEVVFTIKSKK